MQRKEEMVSEIMDYSKSSRKGALAQEQERRMHGEASAESVAIDERWIARAADVLIACPELKGTEKQTAYASDVRRRIVVDICAGEEWSGPSGFPAELLDQFKIVDDAKVILDRLA